jgi:hypothetical protein
MADPRIIIEALEDARGAYEAWGVGTTKLDRALTAARSLQAQPQEALTVPAGHKVVPLDKKLLDAMVNRFLGWRLPDTFGPDCFVSFDRERAKANGSWPIGTNLLTADEARAMLEYVLDATFIPEWSLLEATQASLREHWAMIKELRAQLATVPAQAQQPAQQLTEEQCGQIIDRAYDFFQTPIKEREEGTMRYAIQLTMEAVAAAPQQPAQQAVRVPLTVAQALALCPHNAAASRSVWLHGLRAGEEAHGISPPPAAKEGENQA